MARLNNEPDDDDWVDVDDESDLTDVGDDDELSPIEGLFADELNDVDDLIEPDSFDDDEE